MKQLLILSGKGGTGKTTVASGFIKLAQARAYADCDVDAPNLHLLMDQDRKPRLTDYYGLAKAEINQDLCIECGLCAESCRFSAINNENGYRVDYFACEGCGVCARLCPTEAITLKPAIAGELQLYASDTVFSTAQLKMGSGNSGLLVSEVKKQMKSAAANAEVAIIDGSPGIGCPVIASLSGVDLVLIVAEPSLSGISDLERIIKTAEKFQVKTTVCVNKYDTNLENTKRIASYCAKEKIPFVGRIPFDPQAVQAVNQGLSIVDLECPAGEALKEVYDETIKFLKG